MPKSAFCALHTPNYSHNKVAGQHQHNICTGPPSANNTQSPRMDPQHPLQHSHHSTPNPTIVQYPMVTLLQRQQHPPSHNKVVPQPIDSSNFLGPAQNLVCCSSNPKSTSSGSKWRKKFEINKDYNGNSIRPSCHLVEWQSVSKTLLNFIDFVATTCCRKCTISSFSLEKCNCNRRNSASCIRCGISQTFPASSPTRPSGPQQVPTTKLAGKGQQHCDKWLCCGATATRHNPLQLRAAEGCQREDADVPTGRVGPVQQGVYYL